jgi:hypothetical protein
MAESLELITDLKPGQARQITEKIKRGIGEVADLIRIAHEGRAWAALGYETAQAWLRAEFEGASRGKVWRLETQLHVIEAIQRETGEVVEVSAREAEAVAKEARRSGKPVSEVAQARRARDAAVRGRPARRRCRGRRDRLGVAGCAGARGR